MSNTKERIVHRPDMSKLESLEYINQLLEDSLGYKDYLMKLMQDRIDYLEAIHGASPLKRRTGNVIPLEIRR